MLLDTRKLSEPTAAALPPAEELIDLTTGEVLDQGDPDVLIAAFERVKQIADSHYALKSRIATAIAKLSDGEAKTRRVRGRKRIAKVEMPDDYWTQSILKEAWHAYPNLREEFLRIEYIGVKAREWKKLKETAGPPDVEQFKKMLAVANVGPAGTPRITVEK